jgi:glycosyltransferase involved in cell wall biosynthesis
MSSSVHDGETVPAERPRVAMMLGSPPGPRSGGPGTFVAGLSDALRRNGRFEVVVLAPARTRGGAGQRGSQLLLAYHQFRELRRTKPDVIHAHAHPALLIAAVAYRAVSGTATRIVFTDHIDPAKRGALWTRLVLGWLLSRSDVVTVFAQDSVPKLSLIATPVPRPDAVHVVQGAAAAPRARRREDPEVVAFGATIGYAGGPLLLQVSNFVFPAKVAGALRLVEAMAKVREHFPTAQLLLVGVGPLVGSVRAARDRLGLTGAIAVPGAFIEDLSLATGLSDVHCHISFQDACPLSVLEAMHAGKPLVVSRAAGIPEVIDDGSTGLLVNDDPEQIAEAIVRLLKQPEHARAMGLRAQQVAASRFSWERVAAEFERLYASPQ